MSRILRIELRRSAAAGAALALFVAGVVLLSFVGATYFATGWMQLVMTQRLFLAILWPLALAAGAWQARREHRSNVLELFASTPRPVPRRVAPTLGAMAVAVVCGYLAMGVAGGLWIAGTARYLPAPVFAVTAVGCLALVAAVWLGLAIGRLLPSPVTAPVLGVAGLAMLLLIPGATRPRGWLALVFSPMYEMNMPDAYATVPARASLSQAIWLAALAVTAVVLFASSGRRARVAAVLPAALGAAMAVAVMPHHNRLVTDAIDPVAQELVCTGDQPRVCVSRVHAGLLTEVTGRARDGLAALAKLPGGPTRVHEDTTTYAPYVPPRWNGDVALLRIEVAKNGHLKDEAGVREAVVSAAFKMPRSCQPRVSSAQTLAATGWLLGREPNTSNYDAAEATEAVRLWRDLRQLPAGEALARVAALHQASVNCTDSEGVLSRSTR